MKALGLFLILFALLLAAPAVAEAGTVVIAGPTSPTMMDVVGPSSNLPDPGFPVCNSLCSRFQEGQVTYCYDPGCQGYHVAQCLCPWWDAGKNWCRWAIVNWG